MKKNILILFSVLLLCASVMPESATTVVIRGGEIHIMDGRIIKEGIILIEDGRITEIGKTVSSPANAEVIQADGFILYPGFVAPSCLLTSKEIKNFESFTPDVSALDRFDVYGDYTQYIVGGVTSAFIRNSKDRLISGRGAVVKFAGKGRRSKVIKKEAALNINLGKNAVLPPMTDIFPAPISPENPLLPSLKQYPSSVLGAYWILSELFRNEPYSGDLAKYMDNISISLRKAQEEKLQVVIFSQKAADIYQSIKLAKNFGMPLIIQGGAEAFRLVEMLKKNSVSVIVETFAKPSRLSHPQIPLSTYGIQNCDNNIPTLIKEGIPVAIAPESETSMSDLLWIACYYQKYGISIEELIKTITINPARMFGVEDKIGSLGIGKDADILFFKREPRRPLLQLKKVMIEGRVVYEQ